MRLLRTNTAIRLTVGPFFDETDGVTPQTALTVTNEKLTFMVDDGNVPTLVLDTAPTASGGANDMVHVTGDDAGFYDLELAAADVNYLGRAMLALTNAAAHCPVFHEFMIVPANVYDSFVLGTDLVDVSVTQWLGTAAATPNTAGKPLIDVDLWKGSAPNALQSGRVDGYIGALAAAVITATGIASDAITSAKIQDGAITAAKFASNAISAAKLATDAIQKIVNGVWDEILNGGTHNIGSSAGRRLRTLNADIVIFSGTATAGGTNTITLPAGASATNDVYVGAIITISSGAGAGQTRKIINYVASTRIATVDKNWVVNPNNTSVFDITAGTGSVISVEGQIVSATNNTATIGSEGSANDDIYTNGVMAITSGTGAGQYRDITDYVGSTKVVTVATNWSVNPDNTSGYAIVPAGTQSTDTGSAAPSSAEVANAVLNELLNGHTTAGSLGKAISDIDSHTDTEIADIKAKTDNLPASPAAVGSAMTLTAAYDASKTAAQASDIPTADIAAIKVKTDNLPADPADESNILAAISALNNLSLSDIQTMIIEGTITFEQAQRILLAFAAGLTSGFVAGAPSSAVFKNPSGGATRMTGDIDVNGNRSNVVLTP